MFHVKPFPRNFGVIVIGGGHAGIEASLASARMGVSTAMVTLDSSKIGEMSCNPSIGGVGKGQLTKEIDALGGEMGINADFTGIQFKRLNTKKGSAVQSSRCQSDKKLYSERIQKVIESTDNLYVVSGEVKSLKVEQGEVKGIILKDLQGAFVELECEQVVVTTGTFMKGLMHCGPDQTQGGRAGEKNSVGLSDHLRDLGFEILRLKTGTPPRLIRESIDFSKMEVQPGDSPPRRFSFWNSQVVQPQVDCHLSYTNELVHRVIQDNIQYSPLFSGAIKGIGPRYCPSIEDKVVKFPEKSRHTLFFEPESLTSNWIYPNGISTSLPAEVQEKFIKQIPGCEEVQFARFGYAVEYDCINPIQLEKTLETKKIKGLFFGGQVNGTSGYEEAAAQGLIAGINAALRSKKEPPFLLSRAESYIGVMLDDLTSLGVTEPYRMFTSRAEFRLSLREDNADLRLSPYGFQLGLLSGSQWESFLERKKSIETTKVFFNKVFVKPTSHLVSEFENIGAGSFTQSTSISQLLKRPEVGIENLQSLPEVANQTKGLSAETIETVEIEVKYEGYIQIQAEEIQRLSKLKEIAIPKSVNYGDVIGLSSEVREKLKKAQPDSVSEASKISGITPAALGALIAHIRNKEKVSRGTSKNQPSLSGA